MAEISLKKEVIETTIANINTNVSNLKKEVKYLEKKRKN